ncbi:MAG: hypothetical protein Kow0047_15920 [Anaerolineae bacterium]
MIESVRAVLQIAAVIVIALIVLYIAVLAVLLRHRCGDLNERLYRGDDDLGRG